MKMFKIALALTMVSSVVFLACKKDARTSTLLVKMTDAPASYDEVNVDLKEVNVNFTGDSTGWVSLEAKPGIYNLLGLQNGLDTLIGQGTFPTNTVREIRLVLGDSNTVKVNGQIYPLTIPSGATSGLKLKVDKKLNATFETVVVDFDAALSITQETDGYKLRPVVRVK